MNEKLLKELVSEVQSVYSKIPDDADLYNVEDKLDKLIKLMEEQCEISTVIADRLDAIHNDLPDSSHVSTSRMESLLEKLCDKLDESNSQLGYIEGNMDKPVKVNHLRRMKVSRVNEVFKIDSFVC